MQRYAALWIFPVLSLVLVIVMAARGVRVVDAPVDGPSVTTADMAQLAERNTNLTHTLTRSAAARSALQQHVSALHDELSELRTARAAIVAEAKLWRDSYDVLAGRFDELAALTRVELESDRTDATFEELTNAGAQALPAAFARGEASVPRPAGAVIVR